jgi:hypothetical protein
MNPIDPKLGPLADNNGVVAGAPGSQRVVQTAAVLAGSGSPALGAGNPATAMKYPTDERGMNRNLKAPNIGAYEDPPASPWSSDPSPVPVTTAEWFGMTVDLPTAFPNGTDLGAVAVLGSPISSLSGTQDPAGLTWDDLLAGLPGADLYVVRKARGHESPSIATSLWS